MIIQRQAPVNAGRSLGECIVARKKSALTRGVVGSEEGGKRLADLERRLLQCKRNFELYFNGLEKKPPLVEFEALKRAFRDLTRVGYSTSVLRFKVQNLIARWQVWRALWERQMLKMEQGTYKPGVGAAPGRATERVRGRPKRGPKP